MRIRTPALAVILVLSGVLAHAADLTAGNWKRVRDQVLPDAKECTWLRVPWRASLWDAVIEANRDGKPILLWAMNGHALACT